MALRPRRSRGLYNGEPPQLTTGDLGPLTKLVTISIGGNDLNFAGIITDSMGDGGWEGRLNAPGHSAYDRTKCGAYQQADQLQTTLVNAYKAIKTGRRTHGSSWSAIR